MKMLEEVLLWHGQRYPMMEPQDAVKLIYQNEFGGGHLIRDPDACLCALHQEYVGTPQESDSPLLEDIGNGIVRVMLHSLDAAGLSVEQLGQCFLSSSQQQKGDLETFLQKLDTLRTVTASGVLPFSSGELEEYLENYKQAGYPMVSHSRKYREAYRPAYRVVRQELLPDWNEK